MILNYGKSHQTQNIRKNSAHRLLFGHVQILMLIYIKHMKVKSVLHN